jgi:hypothetical protein
MDDEYGWGEDDDLLGWDEESAASSASDSGSDDAAGKCVEDCALIETEMEHRLFHLFLTGRADFGFSFPIDLSPPAIFPLRGELNLSPFVFRAGPEFRVRDHFDEQLDEDEKGWSEEELRFIFFDGDCAATSAASVPQLWRALRGACPPLERFVELVQGLVENVQDHMDRASPGQRVWPAAFRAPRHFGLKWSVQKLTFLALALDRPAKTAEALVAIVEAVTRTPCVKRGAPVCWREEGCAVELLLQPPPGGGQEAAVKGRLFIAAADQAAVVEARAQLQEKGSQPRPQRRRRRGR